MSGKIILGGWLPGLPHVLRPERSGAWALLERAGRVLGESVAKARPDAVVLYSTQWISVLGTSFQTHPRPAGVHVDENWYELGDLEFGFSTDAELARACAESVANAGMPTKTVNFDEFPIDTGTIVANRMINPHGKLPLAIVSSWVYADAAKSRRLGEAMREAVEASGKRVVVLATSLLTTKYFTEDIDPSADKLSNPEDDAWNRKLLGVLETGELSSACALASEAAGRVPLDMQGNALHWMNGMLGDRIAPARVLAYGPLWGTGAAVMELHPEAAK